MARGERDHTSTVDYLVAGREARARGDRPAPPMPTRGALVPTRPSNDCASVSPLSGDDDRDPRRRASANPGDRITAAPDKTPERRPGDPRSGGPRRRVAVHDRDPGRESARRAKKRVDAPGGDRRRASPARSRAGGDRPELSCPSPGTSMHRAAAWSAPTSCCGRSRRRRLLPSRTMSTWQAPPNLSDGPSRRCSAGGHRRPGAACRRSRSIT